MSYDISLYTKNFLEYALRNELGDWTQAEPIPQVAVDAVIEAARAEGFVPEGAEPARSFTLDSEAAQAELHIHAGEIAFAIPYGTRAQASIELCTRVAKAVARQHGLGFWDPQRSHDLEGEEEDDTPMLLELLRSGDQKGRETAAEMLGGRDAERVATALATAARNDALEGVRRRALESLGNLGEDAAATFEDVMACLGDSNPIIQYWATYAVARLGPVAERALPALEKLSQSSEHGPRYGSLEAIRRIRERRAALA